MDPQQRSKSGLHDARTTSYYAADARGGHRLLANHASARDDTPRSATHATRTSSTSAAPAQRIVPMRCPRPLHSAVCSPSRVHVGYFFRSSLVESRPAHTQNTTRSRTYLTRTSMRPAREPALCDACTRVANGRAGCRTRRESATLDLAAVGIHIARAPLASQARHVGIERYCSASRRLRGAHPACQRRRAAPAIRAPASQLCVSRRGASAQHAPRTSPRPRHRAAQPRSRARRLRAPV